MRLSVTAFFVSASALMSGLGAGPASADTVLEKARSFSQDGPVYLFDMDYSDGTHQFRMSVDPRRESGDMVVGVSPAADTLSSEARKKYQTLKESTEGEIWCNAFAASIPETAKRVSENGTHVSYRFTPVPEAGDAEAEKLYKYLEGSATIDRETGAILSFGMVAPKPFKPAMAARIERFEMQADCQPAPDGRPHIHRLTLSLAGSALMQRFDESETRILSNLQHAPQAGSGAP